MDIQDYRTQIDEIDRELIKKMEERMRISEKIAQYKDENGLRILDPVRERKLLDRVQEQSSPDLAYYNRMLFSSIMEMSRDHQVRTLNKSTPLTEQIMDAIENTPKTFPEAPSVACQGVQGAYSQQACDKMFKMAVIMYMKNFRGVFAAIDAGLCHYGVLPIENSTAGSVNQVYDLMQEYHFHIVRSMRIRIDHCLLVNSGTNKEDIKDIYSHEQALSQCEDYLKHFPMATLHVCENTAEAAKMVAESGRHDAAAIGSVENGELYGLECLEESIQDRDNNYTRFICIAKDLEIYPGADRTSIMIVLRHEAGSLYQAMARFNAMGINLLKLESRPLPSREFEFMFYFDIEESVYTEAFAQMINQLQEMSLEFRYLGSYEEY